MTKPYIIFDENAQYYECKFSCDNAIVLRCSDGAFFITDARYTTEAKQNCVKSVEIIESNALLDSLCALVKKLRIKELVINPSDISLSAFQKLQEKLDFGIKFILSENFHQKLRIIKNEDEIKLLKKSQALNKAAFKAFGSFLQKAYKAESSEKYLHYKAQKYLSHSGAYDLSFNPIVGINANAAKSHALPCERSILKKNDLLLFDAGIKYERYCSDMTRTARIHSDMSFSKNQTFKNKKHQKIYDIVRKAQDFAIKNLKAGMSGKQIDKLARDVIESSGYGAFFSHSTGHGVGLDIHELPRISRFSEDIIKDGMVFSIEPGIYLPDEFGVRIEDLVLVKNGKAEIL